MNSFNKTMAAIFPMQDMLPEDFPFFSDCVKAKWRIIGMCNVMELQGYVIMIVETSDSGIKLYGKVVAASFL